jgi:hypothetical protein
LHWQHLYFFFGKAEALPKENPFAYIPMFSRGNENKLIWSAELVNEKWGAQPKNGGIFSKSQNTQENNFHVKNRDLHHPRMHTGSVNKSFWLINRFANFEAINRD